MEIVPRDDDLNVGIYDDTSTPLIYRFRGSNHDLLRDRLFSDESIGIVEAYTRQENANSDYTALEGNLRIFTCAVEKVFHDTDNQVFLVSIINTHKVANFDTIDIDNEEIIRLLCEKVLYEVATGFLCPNVRDIVICDCDVYYNRIPIDGRTGIHRDSIAVGNDIDDRNCPEFVSLEYFLPGGYFLGPEAFILPYQNSRQSTYTDQEYLDATAEPRGPSFRLAVSDGSVIMFSNSALVHATPSRTGDSTVMPHRITAREYLDPVRRSFLRTWYKQIPFTKENREDFMSDLRRNMKHANYMEFTVHHSEVAQFDETYNYRDQRVLRLLRGGLNNNHEISFKIESNLFKLSFDHPLKDISNPKKYIEKEKEKIKEIISLLTEMKNNKKIEMDDIKMNSKQSRKHKIKNSRKHKRKHKRKSSRKHNRK